MDSQPDELTTLRQEYDQYCRVLGERSYVLWVTTNEVEALRNKIADLNKKASELAAAPPKEQSNDK